MRRPAIHAEAPPPRCARAFGWVSATTATTATTASATAPAPPAPVVVTILYTSDEHGWLQPVVEKGVSRGGAAEALAQWVGHEGHCAGGAPCPDPGTLLLSGGDNYTGPAISTYFQGEPMADAMARLGYAASAFGNHELDFGRDGFLALRAHAKLTYLAANVHVRDPALKKEIDFPAFQIFERRGVKIGVVGLATETTLSVAMPRNFVGIEIEAEEPALERAVKEAWAAGPDALVLIAHECPERLSPILERHADWRFSFVGTGHCHKRVEGRVLGAPMIEAGARLQQYARVRLTVDRSPGPPSAPTAPGARTEGARVSAEAQIIDIAHPAAETVALDPGLVSSIAGWQGKLDRELGAPIGYTAEGFDQEGAEIVRWIGAGWRAQFGADIAVMNRGGIRQSVPKGPISRASVWSVLPFDNRIVLCKIKGSDLPRILDTKDAAVSGVTRVGGGLHLAGGKPIDPDRVYVVATTDFIYNGGDKFPLKELDPAAKETGIDWRTPVIAWTAEQKSSPAAPIERAFDAKAAKPKQPGKGSAAAHP